MNCPCCGSTIAALPPYEAAARELPPKQSAVLRVLASNFGQFTPTARIAQIVWGRDPSGGPDDTAVAISQAVRRMRPTLAKHGVVVEARQWFGYRVRAS